MNPGLPFIDHPSFILHPSSFILSSIDGHPTGRVFFTGKFLI